MTRIRVGLIGANVGQGWAGAAHVPAIRAVDSLELAAVATRDRASADAAAEAFGVSRAFDDPIAMIRDPDVDLIAVVVRAPGHQDLVMAALAARKAVYCEWPLGIDLEQSVAMAEAAEKAGVPTAIGLQGRSSPWLQQIKALVAEGFVGRVLSTTLTASDLFSTGTVARSNAYMLDAANGANALTIHGGHFLDAVTDVLGEFAQVRAVTTTSRPDVTLRETGETVHPTSPDQIVVAGLLEGGGVAAVHIRAGQPGDEALRWEIQGDQGFLRITSETGYAHWRPLVIAGSQGQAPLQPMLSPAPDAFTAAQGASDDPHWNLARHYAAFAQGIRTGRPGVASFGDAVIRHRLIERIRRSAEAVLPSAAEAAS